MAAFKKFGKCSSKPTKLLNIKLFDKFSCTWRSRFESTESRKGLNFGKHHVIQFFKFGEQENNIPFDEYNSINKPIYREYRHRVTSEAQHLVVRNILESSSQTLRNGRLKQQIWRRWSTRLSLARSWFELLVHINTSAAINHDFL